ncbi:hypothetical protein [Streptomyces chumphonensis]|uniref:hypothetical protein n=1 Tax=Streptomyces chumphonensis TaxID=1214925 RepID=UPI003D71B901
MQDHNDKQVDARSQAEVNEEIKEISSEILDIVAAQGKVSEPGPGVSTCKESGVDTHFKMRHTWSLSSSQRDELAYSMERLKQQLPGRGWEIQGYGPNNSQNRNLTLTADHPEKKYGTRIEFRENKDGDGKPMLLVGVVSDCYKVPDGETVERY